MARMELVGPLVQVAPLAQAERMEPMVHRALQVLVEHRVPTALMVHPARAVPVVQVGQVELAVPMVQMELRVLQALAEPVVRMGLQEVAAPRELAEHQARVDQAGLVALQALAERTLHHTLGRVLGMLVQVMKSTIASSMTAMAMFA